LLNLNISFFFSRDYLGKQAESSAGNSNTTNNNLGQRPVESRA